MHHKTIHLRWNEITRSKQNNDDKNKICALADRKNLKEY